MISEWKFEPIDRRWYTHTPNYYFPKADTYLDMKTATMIFILGSVGKNVMYLDSNVMKIKYIYVPIVHFVVFRGKY